MAGMKKGSGQTRLNAVSFAMLLEELTAGPCTWNELADHTGLHRHTILSWINALRARHLVYIASWEKDPRGVASRAAYAFGQGKDAKRPKRTGAEWDRDYRERKARTATHEALTKFLNSEEHVAMSAQLGLAAFMRGLG